MLLSQAVHFSQSELYLEILEQQKHEENVGFDLQVFPIKGLKEGSDIPNPILSKSHPSNLHMFFLILLIIQQITVD